MQTLRLKPRHALPLFSRHPWVFATALQKGADGSDLMPGMEVVVATDRGEPIARGLVNPASLIRVRLYSWTPDKAITNELLASRIRAAIELRRGLGYGDSCRLIFSEADGLSGLTVDSYDRYLLVQLTSAALATRVESLLDLLEAELSPPGIWLRTDPEIASKEGLDPVDRLARGDTPPRPITISQPTADGTLTYFVDLRGGQKTGFYYDQRENRIAAAAYAAGQRVFDGHCYTGGFAFTAAKAGAKSVLAVDSSESAITMARLNAEANDLHRTVTFEEADVGDRLAELHRDGETFGVVIVDPPKLARSRKGLSRALKAYVRLNVAAVSVLEPGGILVTHSCSGLVRDEDFDQMLQQVALQTGRTIRILERRQAARDHATSVYCLETDYLTCRICHVDGPTTSLDNGTTGQQSVEQPTKEADADAVLDADSARAASSAALADAAPNAESAADAPTQPT